MSLKKFLSNQVYRRKALFDPTKNYSRLPEKLIQKYQHKTIVDVGAGSSTWGRGVVTIDLFTDCDLRGDAMKLPLKNHCVDLALSIAVLEHLPEPKMAVDELYRILKPGGEVYIEIPFLQPFHSSPHDYYRATLPGLKHWCRLFKEINSGVCVGPGSAVAWLEIEYTRLWFKKLGFLSLPLELIFRLWTLPLKWLDRFIINDRQAHISASAIYFHGCKPIGPRA